MPLCVLLYLYCTIFYPAFGCHIPIKRIVLYFLKPSAEGCPTARPDCSRPRQGFVRYFCDGILMHYEGLTCDVVVEAAVTLAWRDSAHKRRQVSCVIWPTICAPLGRGVLRHSHAAMRNTVTGRNPLRLIPTPSVRPRD